MRPPTAGTRQWLARRVCQGSTRPAAPRKTQAFHQRYCGRRLAPCTPCRATFRRIEPRQGWLAGAGSVLDAPIHNAPPVAFGNRRWWISAPGQAPAAAPGMRGELAVPIARRRSAGRSSQSWSTFCSAWFAPRGAAEPIARGRFPPPAGHGLWPLWSQPGASPLTASRSGKLGSARQHQGGRVELERIRIAHLGRRLARPSHPVAGVGLGRRWSVFSNRWPAAAWASTTARDRRTSALRPRTADPGSGPVRPEFQGQQGPGAAQQRAPLGLRSRAVSTRAPPVRSWALQHPALAVGGAFQGGAQTPHLLRFETP